MTALLHIAFLHIPGYLYSGFFMGYRRLALQFVCIFATVLTVNYFANQNSAFYEKFETHDYHIFRFSAHCIPALVSKSIQ